MLGHIFYLLVAAALFLAVPEKSYSAAASVFIVIGIIGMWRYAWAAINFVRALLYLYIVYPKMRRNADKNYAKAGYTARAFFLTTTYKIETAVTLRVYRELFAAARSYPSGAIIVASVVDMADQRFIQNIYDVSAAKNANVSLEFVRIPGTGKRDALACGIAAITKWQPSNQDVVIFVDGDSCVPLDIIDRVVPFFAGDPRVGALTTDELCETKGSPLFQDWYALRFSQRQMVMCSLGLSRRVLTLTGRMSVFRGDVVADPTFLEQVQKDEIEHWRLGNVKFLTGDDKSTWFWLLKNKYHMLYLPDVASLSMEGQPKDGFIESAQTLMVRWFGNTMRNNARSLALSPAKIGYFTWWSILDQRLSMWTTLTGPISVLLGTLFVDPFIIVVYASWIMFSRYVYCLLLTIFRESFPISYPFIAYFNQIYGSVMKTWVFFRLDRQKWTRQAISVSGGGSDRTILVRQASSIYMQGLCFAGVITIVALLSGVI